MYLIAINEQRINKIIFLILFFIYFFKCGAARMEEFKKTLRSAHNFLKSTQVPENPPNFEKYYRQMSKVCFHFFLKI